MSEGRIDDEMIEIGDPNEEPIVAEPPHKVVIEYRERGVPWMLIPPLLILSAVVAVVGYHKLAPSLPPAIARVPLLAGPTRAEDQKITAERNEQAAIAQLQALKASQAAVTTATTENTAPPDVVLPPAAEPAGPARGAIEKPAEAVTLPPAAPAEVIVPAAEPLPEIVPSAAPDKPADPPKGPRLTGLGFDQKALEAEQKGESPPADPALTPAVRQDPARPAVVDEKNLPREVAPDLLPPDPRLAKVRQREREAEAVRQIDLDRVRFHNDLREICRIARADYIKEVIELSDRYGMQLDPNVQKRAINLFGQSGQFAGTDRQTRIDVLREIGFPETLVLEDIFDNFERKRIGERNGPRNTSEAMHRSILFLLRYAPGQRASARPFVIRPTPGFPPNPPTPAFSANPGGR